MAEYQSLTIDQDQHYPSRHEMTAQALFTRLEVTAGVMLKNPELCIFRRLDKLHLINLVNIQDLLTQMEKDLAEQVEKMPREDLEEKLIGLGKLLKEYDDAMKLYARNADFLSPQKSALRLLESKLEVHNQQLRAEIGHEMSRSTLMSLIPSQAGLLQNFIDTHHSIRRFFAPKPTRKAGWLLEKYSLSEVQFVEQIIITFAYCFVLLCPIFLLTYVENQLARLGLVLGFVMAVSFFTAGSSTVAKKTNLGIVAAYAATLVVFLGQG